MSSLSVTSKSRGSGRAASPAVTRERKKTIQQVLVVMEPEHDLGWLGRLKAMHFEPILMDSNFDAVQRMSEDLNLRLVLFSQRSLMMDGITACQLLRQSRSEGDVAIILLLDDKLDEAVDEAFAAGASDVVCQPYTASELVARVDATRQRLQMSNDIDDIASFGTASKSATPIVETPSVQERPHFTPQKRRQPSSTRAKPVEELPAREAAAVIVPEAPSLLLGDWLLTHELADGIHPPALDLSQLKFVSTMSAAQIAAARQRGALSETLLDRVWVCPQCRALPSFRPGCPCCGSATVARDRMLHHFACAHVGSTAEFQVNDEGLACPKCCTQRLMVGTDCEYLDGPWRCSACDWNTAELEIVGHCLKCGFRFPSQQAVLEDLVGQQIARGDE